MTSQNVASDDVFTDAVISEIEDPTRIGGCNVRALPRGYHRGSAHSGEKAHRHLWYRTERRS